MPRREIISTPQAPAAIGPYNQAVKVGETLYCSGQIPIVPDTGELLRGDIEEQATQVLDNLGAVLEAAGYDYTDVVRCTIYLADMKDYAAVNEVYARYFKDNHPARETIAVACLPREADVEISCIAVKESA